LVLIVIIIILYFIFFNFFYYFISLCCQSELHWLYQGGAAHLFPDFWDGYVEPIPENERDDMIVAYYKRLTSENVEEKLRCAKAWTRWEESTSKLYIGN